MINEKAIKEFGASLRGELILPADPGEDVARKVYNGRIVKKPATCFLLTATPFLRNAG